MSTTIVTVNAGSSSIRLGAHEVDHGALTDLRRIRYSDREGRDPDEVLREFLAGLDSPPVAVLHRVVIGDEGSSLAVRIDPDVERGIEAMVPRAPLHNPIALKWIRAGRLALPDSTPVAVFDTGFFAGLPAAASEYALPAEYRERYGIRRTGFHGLAHRAMSRRWCELNPEIPGGGRVITLQLGSGASIAAIADGAPQDTSMGFSPLEGLVMATRPGDVDPGALVYLLEQGGLEVRELSEALSHRSGLRGLAETDQPMDELVRSRRPEARLAVDVFIHRIKRYVGAFMNVLGGCDGIVFGGGIGENVPEVRERVVSGMGWCGIALDLERNRGGADLEFEISAASSAARVWVIPVDEAVEMIAASRDLLGFSSSREAR